MQVAKQLLTTKAIGTDLLEVGYPLRSGVNLAHYVALWDIMSRNSIFLTGNGTSDDHFAHHWRQIPTNWNSAAWAASIAQTDLVAALAAGRVWCGSLAEYARGTLDLLVDGKAPMGSVSVSKVAKRQLVASATGIPRNGSLQVLQGRVDNAGTADVAADTKVIATYPAADLAGGSVTLSVDNSASSFVRTQVLDKTGTVIGLSNPAWLYRSPPPGGIPPARAV